MPTEAESSAAHQQTSLPTSDSFLVCADGLFYGNPGQLLKQAVAVAAVAAFTAAVTWIILKVVDVTVGLRVPEQEEVLGLDTTTHGEVAYQL